MCMSVRGRGGESVYVRTWFLACRLKSVLKSLDMGIGNRSPGRLKEILQKSKLKAVRAKHRELGYKRR